MSTYSDSFIREPERLRITGLSRTTWWRLERRGLAPRRRILSPNAVGWLRTELQEWIRSRQERSAES